jgi:hypothetical protein
MKNQYRDGDTMNNLTIRIAFHPDYDSSPFDDCHELIRRSYYPHREGLSDKKPGERPLNQPGRNEYQYYYDFANAIKQAKAEQWNIEPFDTPDKALRAVQLDFDHLRQFITNDWYYVGVDVALVDSDGGILESDSIWGVETYMDYHEEVADEMVRKLIAAHYKEQRERTYWEQRDVSTSI